MIIPVQWVKVMSSSFSRPQLMVPSPTPFCPCSSSSNNRKFRGITEMINNRYKYLSFVDTEQVFNFFALVGRGRGKQWLPSPKKFQDIVLGVKQVLVSPLLHREWQTQVGTRIHGRAGVYLPTHLPRQVIVIQWDQILLQNQVQTYEQQFTTT